jgi:hypothetical protein
MAQRGGSRGRAGRRSLRRVESRGAPSNRRGGAPIGQWRMRDAMWLGGGGGVLQVLTASADDQADGPDGFWGCPLGAWSGCVRSRAPRGAPAAA